MNDAYPVRFSVDYPGRSLNRLTTAFRIFTVIPIAIGFPAIGPSVFLAAELTPETQSQSVDILYRRTGGR